ncbi:MAG: hypothetical protein ACK54T_04585 [bacterium]
MSPRSAVGQLNLAAKPLPRAQAGGLLRSANVAWRRGSVLVLVIGILALLAILVVVYTAVGQADVRAGKSVVGKAQTEDQSRAVGNYISQIIGDNATATYFQKDAAVGSAQIRRVTRQQSDYPSTDPVVRSVRTTTGPQAIPTIEEWRSRRFTPTGTQRYYWWRDNDPRDQDPRISSDPWLASTEPVWINTNATTLTQPSDLVARMTDWVHMSVISPDGRAVNLANLRDNLAAPSGYGSTPAGAPGISLNLHKLTASTTVGGPVVFDTLASTDDLYNAPATWSNNGIGLFRHVLEPQGPTPLLPSDPKALGNMFADADGDGYYDSFWQELVDASDPGQPVNILGRSGLRLFVAPRIIDLSALVNVNTAASFADPFSSRVAQVQTPTAGLQSVQEPIFPAPSLRSETAFRAAPVRYRATVAREPIISSRKYAIEAPPGATPADVDLERLLTGFDTFRYLERRPTDYFGPAPTGGYGILAGQNDAQFVVSRAEVGGSGFSSLMFARTTGQTDISNLNGFPTSPATPYPFFEPGRLAYSLFHSDRGLPIFGQPAVRPPVFIEPDDQRAYDEAQGSNLAIPSEREVIEQYRLFVSPIDRQELYLRVANGNGTRFDRAFSRSLTVGPAEDEYLQFQNTTGFPLTEERELRAYNGVNDPAITSPLESALDFRNFDAFRTLGNIGPMRSNRSLYEDRDVGGDSTNADVRNARLTARFTDTRHLLTTISGARPLTMVSEKFKQATGVTDNRTPSQEIPITQREVRLDIQDAIARALPGFARNLTQPNQSIPGSTSYDDNVELIDTGDVKAANEIFLAYAEVLIPLADTQFDDDAPNFDLWSNVVNVDNTKTSATVYGAIRYPLNSPTGAVPSTTYLRNRPRQNTELALRAAAHMTLNLLAWQDPSDRPIAATLLLNEQTRGDIDGSNPRLFINTVPAFPYWTESTAVVGTLPTTTISASNPITNQWAFGLDFDSLALRGPDVQDLDKDTNTTERIVRLADERPPPAVPTAPWAVNLFAIRPEPVVTQVQSFIVYTDASTIPDQAITTDAQAAANEIDSDSTIADVQSLLDKTDNDFEYFRATISGSPATEVPGNIKIKGEVKEDNLDFLLEMVAFQITNPFDVPIYLSGKGADGNGLKEPTYFPKTTPGPTPPSAGFVDPLSPGLQIRTSEGDALDGTPAQPYKYFSYYIEFGGRFYRLADYTWDPTGDNNTADDNSPQLKGRPVVLQPRQSRVFYVLSQNPAKIAQRMNAAGWTGFNAERVMRWVNDQLWQRFTDKDAGGTEQIVRVGTGFEHRPVRLLPFNRETGVRIVPDSDDVAVLYPQVTDLPGGTNAQLTGKDADNNSVKLWRAVRIDLAGLTEASTGPNNPNNDILVDRLVDPVLSFANTTTARLGSVERRLGMSPADSSNSRSSGRFGTSVKVAGTQGAADISADNTGLSIVMSGGFRRPDDPGAWMDLDSSTNLVNTDYRGIGGGPAPEGFVNDYPRGVLPAWAVEVPMGVVGLVATSSTAWWTNGMPSDEQKRSRNTNYFMLGHPGLKGSVDGSDLNQDLFDPTKEFAAADTTAAKNRPAFAAQKLIGDENALFLNGFTINTWPAPIVTEIAAHPSDKYRQLELVRKQIRGGLFGSDPYGKVEDDSLTLIDQSIYDKGKPPTLTPNPSAFGGEELEFDNATGNFGNDGSVPKKTFDKLYTVLPQYPRTRSASPVGGAPGLSEAPILPPLRPADVLLPWAIGPSQTPTEAGTLPRSLHLAKEWTTLAEAAALAFDYIKLDELNPGDPSDDQSWKLGIAAVLDRGRLRITNAPAPFNNQATAPNELGFPIATAVPSTHPTPPLDRGIPSAMAVIDKFRTMPHGGTNSPVYGTININTAPASVLRMLPMATAMDANRGAIDNGPLHSWMTHGLVDNDIDADGLGTRTTQDQPQQDAPMTSQGFAALTRATNRVFDSRSILRNKPDTVWDVAAAIEAYRDKNAVYTMPSFDGTNRYIADFAEGNGGVTYTTSRFDDDARRFQTEHRGIREEPGFRSIGELLAVRLRPMPATPSGGINLADPARTKLPVPKTENELRDMPVAAQLSIDRFARDLQPADYTFQRRGIDNSGALIDVNQEWQVPMALSALATPEPLSTAFLTNYPLPDNRPVGWLQGETTPSPAPNRTGKPPKLYVDPATLANMKPSSVKDGYEENLLVANAMLNAVSVRSDIFCAYFVLHGYQQSDVEGLSRDAGAPSAAQPMVPTLKRRYMMVVDRSNVTKTGDKPKILLFQELPME